MPRPSDLDRIIAAHVISPLGPTEEELAQRAREADQARLRTLEAKVKALEAAIRTAGKILTPYLGGPGR
jgi:hypothetical protein